VVVVDFAAAVSALQVVVAQDALPAVPSAWEPEPARDVLQAAQPVAREQVDSVVARSAALLDDPREQVDSVVARSAALLDDPRDAPPVRAAELVVRSAALRADPPVDSEVPHLAASPGDPQDAHLKLADCLVVHSAAQLAVHSDAQLAVHSDVSRADPPDGQ
jgi:hypothetical protein